MQGSEWLPDGAFRRRLRAHKTLFGSKDWPQLLENARRDFGEFDHLVLNKKGAPGAENLAIPLAKWQEGARADLKWKQIFENQETLVLQRQKR